MYRKEDNSGHCGCFRFTIQQQIWTATLDPEAGFSGVNRGPHVADIRIVTVRQHCLREGDDDGCSWAASADNSGQIHGVGRTAQEARDNALRARVVAWNLVATPPKVKGPSRKQMRVALEIAETLLAGDAHIQLAHRQQALADIHAALGRWSK